MTLMMHRADYWHNYYCILKAKGFEESTLLLPHNFVLFIDVIKISYSPINQSSFYIVAQFWFSFGKIICDL